MKRKTFTSELKLLLYLLWETLRQFLIVIKIILWGLFKVTANFILMILWWILEEISNIMLGFPKKTPKDRKTDSFSP